MTSKPKLSSFQRSERERAYLSQVSTNEKTNMGATQSGMPNVLSTSKKTGVIAFHSSAGWKAHLQAAKDSSKLMVIDFTATWCGPCQLMEPALNEFAAKYTDVDFIKIDVDELMDIAWEYEVQAMPTFLLIKNGNVVDKIVGARKDDLQKKIERHRF